MNDQTQNPNAIVPVDGFSDTDPAQSPLRGTALRFKEEGYYSYGDEIEVEGKSYAVTDRVQGWQKLQRDCPPEYLMKTPGQPRPPQPHVPKEEWPLDLNNKPAHPWKLTWYVYLLDVATGEFSTFWSNTTGGNIAVSELSDQVALMRSVRPGAIPVVALDSRDMPTQFGSTTPRPYFKILGWKSRDAEPQNLLTAAPKLTDVDKPSLKEQLADEVPFNDPTPDLGTPAPKKKKK